MNVSKEEFVKRVAERMAESRREAEVRRENEYQDYRGRMRAKYRHKNHLRTKNRGI